MRGRASGRSGGVLEVTGEFRPPIRVPDSVAPKTGRWPKTPGSWESLQHQPAFWPGPAFLLTDGSVMCNEWQTRRWWRLWPDAQGQYADSPWQPAASMREVRIFYCASVLADGRLLVGGGYWSEPPNYVIRAIEVAEIYDPASDVWQRIDWPRGFFGDTPTLSCVLADGRCVVGNSDTALCKAYNPISDRWDDVGGKTKDEKSTYEAWTLLPDGSVFAVEGSFPTPPFSVMCRPATHGLMPPPRRSI